MPFTSSHIVIGAYKFIDKVNEVEINSSWKTLADTAVIKLPGLRGRLEKAINVGDKVTIQLGYNDNLNTEFVGYVSKIKPGAPVTVECMDEMFHLQQREVIKAWKSTSVKEVLEYVAPGVAADVPDITLEPFRLSEITAFAALKKLKDEYTLVVYFRDGKLYAGLAYQESGLGEVRYHFQKNCKEDSLEFVKSDDVKVKIKAVSILSDNTKFSVEVGDASGGVVTMTEYNIKTEAELKALANAKIDRYKYNGYRGELMASGLPVAKHSMVADLRDDVYPQRAGKYFIDKVRTVYGQNAFKRYVELGKKAS